ncbi:efflux RND transporter periplasmic adaptor subunit [Corynebacterium uterequi]|uniref:Multidrug resistance efflux pump n=1 Tax=Corynebacterium uterequi TaxID=1072256 RepID=A0A0G3HCU6_9CORY|nr:efflux RND transporter periplasmic adaptor subunit [Corynebacterium uterequi]AKK11181.1 multidrug resistance efflux pump [Corynebacterium uterequi]
MSSTATETGKHRFAPKSKKGWFVIAGVAAFVLLVAITAWSLLRPVSSGGSGIPASDYITVAKEDVIDDISVDATVTGARVTTITTALTGPVTALPISMGEQIQSGAHVATIDASAQQAELDALRAQVSSGKAERQVALDQAQAAVNENYARINDPATPPEEVAALKTQTNALVSARDAARNALNNGDGATSAQINQLVNAVNSAYITAPHAGIVSQVLVSEGQPATGGIATIADNSTLHLKATVGEADVDRVKPGQKVRFTAGTSGDRKYTGKVVRVSPIVEGAGVGAAPSASDSSGAGAAMSFGMGDTGGSSSPQFPVDIEVTGDQSGLRIGGTAKAEIIVSEHLNALALPNEALLKGDKTEVLVAVPEGGAYRVERRTVTTGDKNDLDTIITGGDLKAGDIVLTPAEEYQGLEGTTVELSDSFGPGMDAFTPGGTTPEGESTEETK